MAGFKLKAVRNGNSVRVTAYDINGTVNDGPRARLFKALNDPVGDVTDLPQHGNEYYADLPDPKQAATFAVGRITFDNVPVPDDEEAEIS